VPEERCRFRVQRCVGRPVPRIRPGRGRSGPSSQPVAANQATPQGSRLNDRAAKPGSGGKGMGEGETGWPLSESDSTMVTMRKEYAMSSQLTHEADLGNMWRCALPRPFQPGSKA